MVSGALLALSNLQLLSAAARPPLCALTDRTEVSRRPSSAHLARELRLLTEQVRQPPHRRREVGRTLCGSAAIFRGVPATLRQI